MGLNRNKQHKGKFHLGLLSLLVLFHFGSGALYAEDIPSSTPLAVPEVGQIEKMKELLEQEEPQELVPDHSVVSEEEVTLSKFEAYILGKISGEISKNITQFGYDLFRTSPSTFAPVKQVPVGPDYLLGPGDEFRISIWGKIDADYTARIDREGQIKLPQIGMISLAGLIFSEAQATILQEFGRYYKQEEVKVNISMARLRSIRVFVVGQARRPGSYTISSLSTLIHALFAAGGPNKNGTLRDIQVKRNGQTIVHFDLYDFLLQGDKSQDLRLQSEDVIFIPTVGVLAGIAGNVRVPAIYELKRETTLKNLIAMAGGILAIGYLQQIQIERVVENNAKVVLDVDLENFPAQGQVRLQDGDLVKVFSVIQSVTNSVKITGNVQRPGTYQWKDGMRIGDLLKGTDDLLPETHMKFAMVERLVAPDYHKEYLWINLERLLLKKVESEDILLAPYDQITVFKRSNVMQRDKVLVSGAVQKPGAYGYRVNMKVSDLLKLAGGLMRHTALENAELTRVTPTSDGALTEKITVNLEAALQGDSAHDFSLFPDDYLLVRTVPEWNLYRKVHITGEVRFPGQYTTEKGETLSSLIGRAGGYTEQAYLKGAVFTRESVRKLQQRQLDEIVDRLELRLQSQSAQTIERALTPEQAEQQRLALEQRRSLIENLRHSKAQGRIAIQLHDLDQLMDSSSDLSLHEGDSLNIPERSQQIQVMGSVFNPGAYIYQPGQTVSDYLELSGSLTRDADSREIYILKVDGTAVSAHQKSHRIGWRWDSKHNRWTGGKVLNMTLEPGDTIVAPQKIQQTAWLKGIKDITQILFQVALTTGVVVKLL